MVAAGASRSALRGVNAGHLDRWLWWCSARNCNYFCEGQTWQVREGHCGGPSQWGPMFVYLRCIVIAIFVFVLAQDLAYPQW